MSAPADIKPAASKRPRRAAAHVLRATGTAAAPASVFELSPEEMAEALRFFAARRRMAENYAKDYADTCVRLMEYRAELSPRRPALRLVSGGAR